MGHNRIPVLVAGAGPVGLTLAAELARHGVAVVVLDRLAAPDELVKAGSIGPLAGAFLRRRGLGQELDTAEAATIARYQVMAEQSGIPPEQVVPREHFAGLEKVEHADPSRRRIRVEQPTLVGILLRAAVALGVRVLRGHDVVALSQDADEVRVTAATPDGERVFTAEYVVGCDGGDSAVRALAGIGFPGTAPTVTGRQGVVRLDDSGKLRHGFHYTRAGLCVWGLGVDRVATIEFDGPPDPDAGPMSPAELQASLRRVTGTDVRVLAMSTGGRFTDLAHLAARFRLGRVFLAGDAAHVHAPFGGQGLNTGITDAANLGWKLAATLRGWAPPGLLDTYHAERHPVGERLMANTRAQTALMRPDPHSGALRDLVDRMMDLLPVRHFVANLLSGTEDRYRMAGDHPLTGTFCPDLELVSGDARLELADLAATGRGLLLDLAGNADVRRVGGGWAQRVDVIPAKTGQTDLAAVLVRPDGYLAWALGGGEPFTARPLVRALRTWFGDGPRTGRAR